MRSLRLLVVAFLASTFVAGCSGKTSSGGIQVRVTLAPGLKSTCVRVEATGANGGAAQESGPIVLANKTSPLLVGIAPTGQTEPVTVRAVGYADEGCNSRTVPAEVSDTASGRFTDPVTVLDVTLAPAAVTDGGTDGGADGGSDAGVDQDGDGYFTPEDCDDTNPNIKPGVQELCVDHVDNDCDTLTDCADPTCDAQMCVTGGGAVCSGNVCHETSCGDSADNDGDGMTDCADADCAMKSCGVGGTCTGGVCMARTEANLCGDGVDNDNDTFIDCLDSDCPAGSTCSDLNACTMTDTCAADGGCASGMALACDMPPNTLCYALAGSCQPDAGVCEYTKLSAGSTCSDGRVCTKFDACDADGGCVGAPLCDTPPSTCHASLGTCEESDAGCTYAPLAAGTGSCTDGNNCTTGDSCDGDGGCLGTLVPCSAPTECFARSGCDVAGTCLYAPAPGQPCDAGAAVPGSCSDAGACVPTPVSVFPFQPSNFTDLQLPAKTLAMTFNCGTTTLDTGAPGATSLTWTNNCGGNPTPAFTEVTVGTQKAVLLYLEALTISGTLRAVGQRPLIIAVRNTATISGTLNVGSSVGSAGAGANLDCGSAAGTNGGTGTDSSHNNDPVGGGGGGGAFGGAGAAGGAGAGTATAGGAGMTTGGPTLSPLRGGCNGGNGGRAAAPDGQGGPGGGAVQLTVAGALNVTPTGRVTAFGAGGSGGVVGSSNTRIAGGGGGSGGGILLEAATLSIEAMGAVTANGGSGGEAAGGNPGVDGTDGLVASTAVVAGGNGGTCGGDGGNGGAAAGAAGPGVAAMCSTVGFSGGGGGGGVGRIYLRASTGCTINGSAIVSPAAHGTGMNGCPAP